MQIGKKGITMTQYILATAFLLLHTSVCARLRARRTEGEKPVNGDTPELLHYHVQRHALGITQFSPESPRAFVVFVASLGYAFFSAWLCWHVAAKPWRILFWTRP